PFVSPPLSLLDCVSLLGSGLSIINYCDVPNFPPGPRPLPVIGNLHIFDVKRPYKTMLELSKKYGPIFSIQMGLQKMVVLAGYETVKEALVNQADAFAERPKIPMFEESAKGYGVIFSHGENWKVMRRFTITTLRDFGMGKRVIEDKTVEECRCLIKEFESHKGKPFEITSVLNAAVANVIASILFGKRFDYRDPAFVRLINMVDENARLLGSPSVMVTLIIFILIPSFLKDPTPPFYPRQSCFLSRHRTCLNFPSSLSCTDSYTNPEKSNTNAYFHNENLISLVGNLFAAGTETTSTTLRWGILLMMKYLKIQNNVQEEIAKVMGSTQPRIEHRTKMPYTDAVIHEIQRFANILPMDLPHETTVNVTLKGYFIPKGTYIIPLLASVLYDESQWEKPHTFCPEHFLNSEGKFVKKEAFLPFSAGRRICAGETLAKMELFLFFTSLMQRFTFQPAPGVTRAELDLTPAIGLTNAPLPYKISVVPRC
uniref:Cytochrome P450 family 2 subfamily AC member 68 n=1 Tax=Sphenodon punctatus TaxID=8508 RepID=A0A8D0HPB8_SPHPU